MVTACSWSYKYIGDKLEARGDKTQDEFYRQWRQTYASDCYRQSNDADIALLDRLSESYTEKQLAHLEQIVCDCSEFEYDFWQMCWDKQ